MGEWEELCALEANLQQQAEDEPGISFTVQEICRMLLPTAPPQTPRPYPVALLRLTLLHRCCAAAEMDLVAVHSAQGQMTQVSGNATTRQRVLAAVCKRAWTAACMDDLMTHLASADKWVALAARRALQVLFLSSSSDYAQGPTHDEGNDYAQTLRSHYRRLFQARPVVVDDDRTAPPKGTMAVLKLSMEILRTWRRQHEQTTTGDSADHLTSRPPRHAVGRELLSCLCESLSALVTDASQSVDGLDALCRLLVEALKSARVVPAEAEARNDDAEREREIATSAIIESTTKLALALCPENHSNRVREANGTTCQLVGYVRERTQVDRDSGLRASSSLMRLLTHLFDTDLSSSPSMTHQLVTSCLAALSFITPLERAAARDRATSMEAEDAKVVASIQAQLAPRAPGIERIPLLPALRSTFLAFDEVTQEQLTVIRRRAVLLLTRVCAAFARQFSPPDDAERALKHPATTPPSPLLPRSDTDEGTRKRKAPDTPWSGTNDSHDKQRRRTMATTSEGEHPQAGANALRASLAEFLRAHMGEMPRGGMTTAFFELMSSQDDTMIEVMHHLLTIHETVAQNPALQAWLRDEVHPEALQLLRAQLSPHAVFIGFLQVVGFDHLFLLDLLIGNETSFLAYLCQYLRHLTSHRHALVAICRRIAADEEEDEVDDEVGIEEGRVYKVLRCLHDTIERLDRKGLFPYRAKPLLTLLLQAVAAEV